MTYLTICLLLIADNLYMIKVNTDSYYKLVAQKQYAKANGARRLVVVNLALALGISVLAVWCSF
jgi:hypothetical protein